jgi:predicted AlkP superfamily phosphohydrolase/phosphomutase
LGFYSFRNRSDYSYDNTSLALSTSVKHPRVWDLVNGTGKKSIVLGVPQTFPIKPLDGYMVSSFLTPSTDDKYTYPHGLRYEIERVVGDYKIDVDNFRTENKDQLLADIYDMTIKRFELARHLVANKDWDFFMMVEMGVDRIQHGFWHYSDPQHVLYKPGSKYATAIKDYYKK